MGGKLSEQIDPEENRQKKKDASDESTIESSALSGLSEDAVA